MAEADTVIDDVSDTALWVAHFRALESVRADALFHDPLAAILAGSKGPKIAASMATTSKYTAWTLAIRTHVIDRYIERLIAEGVDVVLNLGAGLDTRPYRMKLPSSLRWIEIDYPHMIDYKQSLLANENARCQLQCIRLDLANREQRNSLFTELQGNKVLVLTEGVIPYLSEQQVAELAVDLHARDNFKFWIAEYFAKACYPYIRNSEMRRKMKNALFQFFPEDWLGFFKTQGWTPREITYLGEAGEKLNRNFPSPWWAAIFTLIMSKQRALEIKRYTGYVIFARADEQAARSR